MCFRSQDYPNKELLISFPRKDKLTPHVIDRIIASNDIGVIKVQRDDEISLGDARNQAIAMSNGEYFCTWDDDDWYHNNRLSYQIHYLLDPVAKFKASILNQLILFDSITRRAYLSFLYPWENTLLCRKDIFNNYGYSNKDRGEDSTIIDLLDGSQQLLHLGGAPFLYIYIYHDQNTWGYSHFKTFMNRSELLDMALSKTIAQLIE